MRTSLIWARIPHSWKNMKLISKFWEVKKWFCCCCGKNGLELRTCHFVVLDLKWEKKINLMNFNISSYKINQLMAFLYRLKLWSDCNWNWHKMISSWLSMLKKYIQKKMQNNKNHFWNIHIQTTTILFVLPFIFYYQRK